MPVTGIGTLTNTTQYIHYFDGIKKAKTFLKSIHSRISSMTRSTFLSSFFCIATVEISIPPKSDRMTGMDIPKTLELPERALAPRFCGYVSWVAFTL